MFNRKELKDLASISLQDDYYVSLYLNVDPKDNPKDKWLIQFKTLAKETLNEMDSHIQTIMQNDITNLESYLTDRPSGLKRGLAVISSASNDFWKAYHTAIPFQDQLVIDHKPYIKPLASMIDTYSRYLIVISGSKRVRFLLSGMGETEELSLIDRRDIETGSDRDGGTGDMGEVRAQKQKEQIQKQLYKDAVQMLDQIQREENIERILLGGSDPNRGKFRDNVPDRITEDIVGEFTVEVAAPVNDVQERAEPVMKEAEYNFERKALDELFGNGNSVLGLSDVLTVLQQGNVHKLYVMSEMTIPGMICSSCGALTPERDRPCPYCDGKMNKVNYMLDLAIQKAIEQGARIDMLDEAPRLVKAGGIGAKLRY